MRRFGWKGTLFCLQNIIASRVFLCYDFLKFNLLLQAKNILLKMVVVTWFSFKLCGLADNTKEQ